MQWTVGLIVIIRRATYADRFKIEALIGKRASSKAAGNDQLPDRIIDTIGKSKHGVLLIAEEAQRLVGLLRLLFVDGGPVERTALIEDMVVEAADNVSDVRGKLLELAMATCRTEGLSRLAVLTNGDNASKERYFRRSGFEDMRIRALVKEL